MITKGMLHEKQFTKESIVNSFEKTMQVKVQMKE